MLKSVKNTILDIIRQADLLLLALCTVTSLFGVVMIYSATRYQGGLKCVIIQLCGLVLGIVLYFVVSMVDLTEISKKWQWLLAFNLGFFLLLKTPLGVSANGNLAWLGVRGIPIQVQPAEVVKLTFILLLARQLVWMKGRGDMKSIPAVGLLAGNLLVTIGLYYVISSDMGSALVYVCIFACMAFAAGVALRWFALGIFGAGAGFYLLWELDKIPPYMKERFQVLVDHSLYPLGAGWQQTRSLMAIGGGRLTGQGLLHGAQTQSTSSVNLPFRHTDFIFAVICEQLGQVFGVLLLAVYVLLILRGVTVVARARRSFEMLLGCGVLAMLGIQTFMIVAGVIKMIPLTGVTMPFLSYGGSSLFTSFAALGMVSGIHFRPKPKRNSIYY